MNMDVDIGRFVSAARDADMRAEFLRDCSRGQLSELVRLDELDDHLAFIAEEAVELAETLWEDMLENVELPDKDRDKYLEEMAERIDDIVCRELIFC